MSIKRQIIFTVLSLAILAGGVWVLYKVVIAAIGAFASLDANVAVAIVAGSTTVLGSTLAIVLGRYFQAKHDRESVHREKKTELYDEFLKKLFELFTGAEEGKPQEEDMVPFLRDVQRKLILWSGPATLRSYAEWNKSLTVSPPRAVQMIKMIEFFLSLRKDLGHSNKGIKPEHVARFILKQPELLVQEYRRNRNVTLDEIAKLEAKLTTGTAST